MVHPHPGQQGTDPYSGNTVAGTTAQPPVQGATVPGMPEDLTALTTPAQFIRVAVECAQTIDSIQEGIRRLEDGMTTLRGQAGQLGALSRRLRDVISKRKRDGKIVPHPAGPPPLSAEGSTHLPLVPPASHGQAPAATRQSDGHMPAASKVDQAENCRRSVPTAKARPAKPWSVPLRAVQWWTNSHRDPSEGDGEAYGRPGKRYRA